MRNQTIINVIRIGLEWKKKDMQDNKKVDKRVKHTDQLIFQAMQELVKTKFVENLMVSEICEKADISRQAFYSRYSIPSDIVDDYCKSLNQNASAKLERCKGNEDWVKEFLKSTEENQEKIHFLFSLSVSDKTFYHVVHFYTEMANNLITNYSDKKKFEEFRINAFVATSIFYLQRFGHDVISLEELLKNLMRCFDEILYGK